MSMIEIKKLTFGYEGSAENVFEDVSFQIDTDWRLGLVGRNGAGKTTFLHLLCGQYDYAGTISAEVSFEYFPYEVREERRLTMDILDEIGGAYEFWELQREFSLLRLPEEVLYRPFETLSNGEKTKTLLAVQFLKEKGFLLIDEPTNHLDGPSRILVGDYLHGKRGFILVSHDRAFLDLSIDHVLSLNRMDREIQKGDFSAWWENKERRDEFERRKNEKLKKEIGRLSEAAKRTSGWSKDVEDSKYGTRNSGLRVDRGHVGHQSAKMMKRSKSIESRWQTALEEKEGLLKNVEEREALKLSPRTDLSGTLFSCRNLSLSYGEKTVAEGITFSIEPGSRMALRGKNGSGKTTLLRLLCGEEVACGGEMERNSRMTVSYVPQDTGFLKGSLRDFTRERGIDESLCKAILRKLGFPRSQLDRDMRGFSAGQKKKVLIAGSLSERAHLYVWDEPLNYIDVFSRRQIEELLLENRPTLLFVEHDQSFCERIGTASVALGEW